MYRGRDRRERQRDVELGIWKSSIHIQLEAVLKRLVGVHERCFRIWMMASHSQCHKHFG